MRPGVRDQPQRQLAPRRGQEDPHTAAILRIRPARHQPAISHLIDDSRQPRLLHQRQPRQPRHHRPVLIGEAGQHPPFRHPQPGFAGVGMEFRARPVAHRSQEVQQVGRDKGLISRGFFWVRHLALPIFQAAA